MTILRVGLGLVYFTNGLAKLPGFENKVPPFRGFLIDRDGARSILESDTSGHPIGIYRDLVEDVILAHWGFFGALVTVTELLIGVCLILASSRRSPRCSAPDSSCTSTRQHPPETNGLGGRVE
jgi:uncharacterized membrane protein YphA (DoxX/SURF4 family)